MCLPWGSVGKKNSCSTQAPSSLAAYLRSSLGALYNPHDQSSPWGLTPWCSLKFVLTSLAPIVYRPQFCSPQMRTSGKTKRTGHNWCHTLKKSKNEMCFTMGPYRLSSCLKKKKLVKAASMSSGCFLLSLTSSSLSLRLSRPRHTAVEFLRSQGGPVLACTDIMSRLTLEDRKCNRFPSQTIPAQRWLRKNSARI